MNNIIFTKKYVYPGPHNKIISLFLPSASDPGMNNILIVISKFAYCSNVVCSMSMYHPGAS